MGASHLRISLPFPLDQDVGPSPHCFDRSGRPSCEPVGGIYHATQTHCLLRRQSPAFALWGKYDCANSPAGMGSDELCSWTGPYVFDRLECWPTTDGLGHRRYNVGNAT